MKRRRKRTESKRAGSLPMGPVLLVAFVVLIISAVVLLNRNQAVEPVTAPASPTRLPPAVPSLPVVLPTSPPGLTFPPTRRPRATTIVTGAGATATIAPGTSLAETATPVAAGPTGEPTASPALQADATASPAAAPVIEAFFTRPIYPDRPENRRLAPIATRFTDLLASATTSIDIAVYEFDLPEATGALIEAARRGVQVRMVTDTDSLESDDAAMRRAYSSLVAAGIPVVGDIRQAFMHHKFAVVDGRWVWTGSWNFTEGDSHRLNNDAVLIDSPSLAANYSAEFNLMFAARTFGPSKARGAANPQLEIAGVSVQNYFAPRDKVGSRLEGLVRGATKSVYFMAFQFTLDNLGTAMAERAQSGVEVSGVFERLGSDTRFSEYGRLRSLGLPVYQDGNPYIMHHKVIVVDEQTVAFGSYNFSASADESNDENVLIVDSAALAMQFVEEFRYVRDAAVNANR